MAQRDFKVDRIAGVVLKFQVSGFLVWLKSNFDKLEIKPAKLHRIPDD
jgi:hypothetical protein